MYHLDRVYGVLFGNHQPYQGSFIQLAGNFKPIVGAVVELDSLMYISYSDTCSSFMVGTFKAENAIQALFIHSYPIVSYFYDNSSRFPPEYLYRDIPHLLQ